MLVSGESISARLLRSFQAMEIWVTIIPDDLWHTSCKLAASELFSIKSGANHSAQDGVVECGRHTSKVAKFDETYH